jgi:hypothetical protein
MSVEPRSTWGPVQNFIRAAAIVAALAAGSANAEPPCDFKGLSVGDHASPEQIMKMFGVEHYKDKVADEAAQSKAEQAAAFDAMLKRAAEVGLMNAGEEREFRDGPACDASSCRIPYGYGVTVGGSPFPNMVGVFIAFDNTGKITAIDVHYDNLMWDEILDLMNTKYGDSWQKEVHEDVVSNYETKKIRPVTVIALTHRPNGKNPKTGDACTIKAGSVDLVFEHSMVPIMRGFMEIKLVSTNF